MASKYEALEFNLASRATSIKEVSMSFKEIEEILGSPLPRSAYTYREWWSNQRDLNNRPQAKAWTAAGFKVDSVDQHLSSGSVVFVRN